MNVTLQYNASDVRTVDKTLSTIASKSGTLRAECSVTDPVITFEGDITDVVNANYMTISEFGRTYFITDIVSIRNNLYQISGHVDVLTSYASEIRSNTGIIRRQENAWNLYLDDGTLKTYNNPVVITKKFPSGFSTMSFILAVAGD